MNDLLVEFRLMSPTVELILRLPFRAEIKQMKNKTHCHMSTAVRDWGCLSRLQTCPKNFTPTQSDYDHMCNNKEQNFMKSFVISPASCFGTEARKMQTYCTYNNLFILSCTYHYFRIVSKYLALEVLALSTRQGWAHGRSSCSARRWCCGWCSRQIRC